VVGALGTVAGAAVAVVLAITVIGVVLTAAIAAGLLAAAALGIALAVRTADDQRHASRIVLVALLVPGLGELAAALATVSGLGAAIRVLSRAPAAAIDRA
jgi:hypothetical protein